MTKEDFRELYDQIYYGHEIELQMGDKRFYLEQGNLRVSVYEMETNPGIKLADITAPNRGSLVGQVLAYECFQGRSIKDCFTEIEIIAVD